MTSRPYTIRMHKPGLTIILGLAVLVVIFLGSTGKALAQEVQALEPSPGQQSSTNETEDRVPLNERLKEGEGPDSLTGQQDLAFGAFQRGNYLTAFSLALPRAQSGDAAAQTLIAELYERGLGVARDPKEAAEWYGIAANAGNREAQFAYAVKLLAGKDVARDADKAIALMKEAADAGHALAKFNYGQHLVSKRPTNRGFAEALPYFLEAGEAGVADAAYALSQVYSKGLGVEEPDEKLALDWLLRAARAGMDTAKLELGIWLINGKGGVRNEETGAGWMMSAAVGGNAIAQNRLAHLYLRGIGLERDQQKAAIWYLRSRSAGHSDLELDAWFQTLPQEMRDAASSAASNVPGSNQG